MVEVPPSRDAGNARVGIVERGVDRKEAAWLRENTDKKLLCRPSTINDKNVSLSLSAFRTAFSASLHPNETKKEAQRTYPA